MIEQSSASEHSLSRALVGVGLSWSDLWKSADSIILFGSRAVDLARSDSDWDLFCVGSGRSTTTERVDLVWISPAALASKDWLTSELAGHVARYGRCLRGDAAWMEAVAWGPEAAARKRRRLAARVAALEQAWPLLAPQYRRRRLALVRRDLQRHALLAVGEAVPPTALLDSAWSALDDGHSAFLALAEAAGLASSFLEGTLTPLARQS